MNGIKLSKESISTFFGNIVTLKLVADWDISGESIIWKSSDENKVFIREFFSNGENRFSDGVLLVMMGVGECEVTAEYDGKVYTCLVKIREFEKAKETDNFNFYVCDFHVHTSKKHNREEFLQRTDTNPDTVLKIIKEEGFFDGYTISDHAILMDNKEFFNCYLAAEKYEDESFVVFPGAECDIQDIENDIHGVPHKNAGEIVTFNSHGFCDVPSWEEYFKNVYKNPYAVGIFNHPQISGVSTKGIWNFKFERKITDEMREMFRMIEVGNGELLTQNLIHERMYSVALDCGLKVAPISTSDGHGPEWGKFTEKGKTYVLAPKKSKEAFLDAVKCNRVYATESGNVKLWYTVNDKICGSTLPLADKYNFKVLIDYFNAPDKRGRVNLLEVVSDYGKTIKEIEIKDEKVLEFEISSTDARYFYLKLTDQNGLRTFSSPVWTGRKADELKDKEFDGVILDKKDWTVKYISGSSCEVNLVTADKENPWTGDKPTAEFIIDMGKSEKINAFGIVAHFIPRRPEGVTADELVARYISDYEIYLAGEDENYSLKYKGTIRCYGEEKISEFEETSARYIKVKILSTVGLASRNPVYKNSPVMIGEIYAYKNK